MNTTDRQVMQQQRQEQQQSEQERLEEYQAAQRAAVESVYVGRATTEAVARQGEQLQNADRIADDTQYKLDKATRVLKGMTWSGMVSNWFTRDVQVPESLNAARNSLQRSMESYDHMPADCQGAAQAVKNYHANLTVLLECETEEQKATCKQICDNMHQQAERLISKLKGEAAESLKAYALQLQADLDQLRNQQLASQAQIRGLVEQLEGGGAGGATSILSEENIAGDDETSEHDQQKEELFGRKPAASIQPSKTAATAPSPFSNKSKQEQQQDQHLAVLSTSLGELGHIAGNLKEGLSQQAVLIDHLDTKSDQLHESSKMVGRRTDRLIQKKSWTPVKAVLVGENFAVRHVATGKFLAVHNNDDVCLVNQFHPQSCGFSMHRRQGNIIGLRNHANRKWMGQSFLTGSLQCAAKQFGRREEFEIEAANNNNNNWNNTRLLCASAGWGHGAYLQVDDKTFAVSIGGSSLEEARHAARWCLINQDGDNDSGDAGGERSATKRLHQP